MIFVCIDPIPFGCDRGDFYATMSLRGADGEFVNCGTTPPIINRDNLVPPSPAWTCSTTSPAGLVGPVTFIIRVKDFDGRSLNALDGDDPVDIGAGYDSESMFPISLGTSTVTSTGTSGSITLTLTATPVPVRIVLATGLLPNFDPRLGETSTVGFSLQNADPAATVNVQILDAADIP